jgi:hypothetical protein
MRSPFTRPMIRPITRPIVRAAFSLTLFSGWLALLFAGFAGGGAVHLLLLAALALFPWRAAGSGT